MNDLGRATVRLGAATFQFLRGLSAQRLTLLLADRFGLLSQFGRFEFQTLPAFFAHAHGLRPRIRYTALGIELGGLQLRHKGLFVARNRFKN
ncbi:MAG: hypothetical protein RBU21_04055 [FCB group bacterium]|nr:hypothetical protein [FCB group bacterium]